MSDCIEKWHVCTLFLEPNGLWIVFQTGMESVTGEGAELNRFW